MEIPTWDQYLQRSQIGQFVINAPYDSSITVDSSFENGSINAAAIQTGTLTAVASLGGNNTAGYVKIDGTLKRFLINDGTGDIILIGYQQGGF